MAMPLGAGTEGRDRHTDLGSPLPLARIPGSSPMLRFR